MVDAITGGRPTDQRDFVHKKLLGFAKDVAGIGVGLGLLPGSGVVSTIARSLAGSRVTLPRPVTARVTNFSQQTKNQGRTAKLGLSASIPCIWPWTMFEGKCVAPFIGDKPGRDDQPVGEAVMGRYGAGLVPGSQIVDRAVCLKGMRLGDDGLCYNNSQVSNKQRMWPAGRKPLLSGGDMRAISVAARAGRRLEGATKRLQRMGMMKKPTSRRAGPHQHAKLLPAVSIK